MVSKVKQFIQKRKTLSILLLILAVGAIYYFNKSASAAKAENSYVLGTVQKGTLITSVSGSGQIAVSSQVDVKAKGSGDILNILAKNGQEVKAGDILVQLNARDALRTVKDAQTNLESAQLSMDKLKISITPSIISQSENAVASAETSLQKLKLSQEINYQKALETKQNAADALLKGYEDVYNTLSDTFLNFPTLVTTLQDILFSDAIGKDEYTVGDNETNSSALINSTDPAFQNTVQRYQYSAETDYRATRKLFDDNFQKYKTVTRNSSQSDIEALLAQTIETAKSITQAGKSELNYLDTWVDYRTAKNQSVFSSVKTYQTNLATSIGQANSNLSSLLSMQRTLKSNKDAVVNADRDIKQMEQNNPLDLAAAEASLKEKQDSLETLKKGVDPLDIRSQQITLQQRQIALSDAREKLGDYTVRAPFDGVIAKIDLRKGDQLSSGSTVATLITKQKIAQISLNELDAAKIQVGQKVTLTFDAVDGLTISGEVGEIDQLGTVSQGVVSYNVKILFDTQDDRIKSGMTVSASIIIDVKTDVLMVENSAVKTSENSTYVEVLDSVNPSTGATTLGVTSPKPPRQQIIEMGISNDTSTEILSGLKEGDKVITRTITPTVASTAAAPSLLGGSGTRGMGGGGGTFRAATGR